MDLNIYFFENNEISNFISKKTVESLIMDNRDEWLRFTETNRHKSYRFGMKMNRFPVADPANTFDFHWDHLAIH